MKGFLMSDTRSTLKIERLWKIYFFMVYVIFLFSDRTIKSFGDVLFI